MNEKKYDHLAAVINKTHQEMILDGLKMLAGKIYKQVIIKMYYEYSKIKVNKFRVGKNK